MSILSGISLHSLLDALPAQAISPALAVSGEGIVLVLQAVAYVLVSLAAIAVLLRFGLRGGSDRSAYRDRYDHGSASHDRCHHDRHAHDKRDCGRGHHDDALAADAPRNNTLAGGQHRDDRAPESYPDGVVASATREAHPQATASQMPPAQASTAGASLNSHQPAPAAAVSSAQVSAAVDTEDADEQRRITAVIAAAVHNVLDGQQHRIVRIQPISYGWAQEGRRDIFSSRRIR